MTEPNPELARNKQAASSVTGGERPRYLSRLAELRADFPSPDADSIHDESIVQRLAELLRRALALKTTAPRLDDSGAAPTSGSCESARLEDHSQPLDHVLGELLECMRGLPLEVHPRNQVNVNVQPSTAGLAGVLLPALFNPNLSSDGRGAGCSDAERRVAAMVASLVGYDPTIASGLFTFGGTGTMLYGVKLGLETAVPDAMRTGIDRPVVVLASRRAHHTCLTAAGWLGIGQNHVWSIPAGSDNSMQIELLRQRAREAIQHGRRIVAIVATVGTTDAFGLDDLAEVVRVRDSLVREYRLDYVPHVHADAVIGWAWSVFREYNFQTNPWEFDRETCAALAESAQRVSALAVSDSLGVDFHKTGFAPYVSSMFLVRDRRLFERLARDVATMPYLFHAGHHHPGMYTLETTRGAGGVLAALASLTLLGREGMQVLLGHAVARAQALRRRLASLPWVHVINSANGGPVTLYRAYPAGMDVAQAWAREVNDPAASEFSLQINQFNRQIYQLTQNVARTGEAAGAGWTERAAEGAAGHPLASLKTYLLSPFLEDQHLDELTENLRRAHAVAGATRTTDF
jgi:L-2,4-diaminobutyrate decarboxylase